jgi:hypothetical protein
VKSALQGIAIFVAMQFFMSKFMGSTPANTTTTDASGAVVTVPGNTGAIPLFTARPDGLDEGAVYNPMPQRIAPIWPVDSLLDLTIVVSPSIAHVPIAKVSKDKIVVEEKKFNMGNSSDKRVIDTTFNVPKEVQNNGTLWGHFYIGLAGSTLDPSITGYDPARAYHFIRPLTQYIPKKKVKKTKSLLGPANETELAVEEVPKGPIITSFYHSNFTMSLIPDSGVMSYPNMHPAVMQYLHLEATGARDGSGQNGWYYPILFVNTFWQLKSHMTELNSTVTTLPFHVDLNTQKNWLFGIVASVDEGAKQTARNAASGAAPPVGGGDGSEFEMFKEILIDTNIYLLGTTMFVSVLHMIFEMLAFSSDIVSSSLPVKCHVTS